MLTPEQTRLRIYDNELRKLKRENQELKDRLEAIRGFVRDLMKGLVPYLPWKLASQVRVLMEELED
jgi:hypothetical protein